MCALENADVSFVENICTLVSLKLNERGYKAMPPLLCSHCVTAPFQSRRNGGGGGGAEVSAQTLFLH